MADLPSSGALSNATLTVGGFKTLIEDLRDSTGQGLTTFQLANTYEEGAITVTSNGVIYTSQTSENVGNSPSTDDGSNWLANPYLNYKGEWSAISGTLYKGMSVSHESAMWVANTDIASVSASEPTASNTNYDVISISRDLSSKTLSVSYPDNTTITLTDTQSKYGRVVITGSLTAESELIVGDEERYLTVKNNTDYAVKVRTSSGTGVHVEVGEQFSLRVESGNVVANGESNKIYIVDVSQSDSGTKTYPFSLTQSEFSSIYFSFGQTVDTGRVRGTEMLTKTRIEDEPTSWSVISSTGATTLNIAITISYDSDTSFSLSGVSGDASLVECIGYFKDGVTY